MLDDIIANISKFMENIDKMIIINLIFIPLLLLYSIHNLKIFILLYSSLGNLESLYDKFILSILHNFESISTYLIRNEVN